jgi:hypothetical protein
VEEVPAVKDESCFFSPTQFVLDIVVPEPIFIVVVIDRQVLGRHSGFFITAVVGSNVVDARVVEDKEVGHALVGGRLYLKVVDVHLLLS